MTALLAARSVLVALAGFAIGLLLAACVVPMAARAAPPEPAPAAAPETRTISIIVYGDDPCPAAKSDEIVVCARQPESERYRIPKRFRGKKQDSAPNNSWANKVRSTEDASRTAAGLPNTCSAVGSGGQSGCQAQFLAQSAAQRKQDKDDAATTP